ncbi:MAG: RNA-directed DNA polymerase [bacterium]|nr:RNA-directed DNA polymerase [bacterium]
MTISDDIFASIVQFDNLLIAFRKASRGKRGLAPASAFEHQVADKLIALQTALHDKTYSPSGYRHFIIYEPKRRRVSAAPFRDRVVHHALCHITEPLFEAQFIPNSYANRIGKGTHRAIDQLQAYSRAYRYCLRADIIQHFPSIDHALLKETLFRVIKNADVRWLISTIIDGGAGILKAEYDMVYCRGDDLFAVNRPRGLPIGNLTSQFWSNCYMNPFDWFIVRQLGCPAYLRYVDDFALFSDSKRQLYQWKEAIIRRLGDMRLTIHEAEAQVVPCEHGIPWLGFVVYPTHRLIKKRNAVKFTQKFDHLLDLYEMGDISFAEMTSSVGGWVNHVRYADTWGLRRHIFNTHRIRPPKS